MRVIIAWFARRVLIWFKRGSRQRRGVALMVLEKRFGDGSSIRNEGRRGSREEHDGQGQRSLPAQRHLATIIGDKHGETLIDPREVASEAIKTLDPERKSPELVRHGCEVQLLKIARRMLGQSGDFARTFIHGQVYPEFRRCPHVLGSI